MAGCHDIFLLGHLIRSNGEADPQGRHRFGLLIGADLRIAQPFSKAALNLPIPPIMVKPLTFKGDKKPKKRKAPQQEDDDTNDHATKHTAAEGEAEDDSWVTAEAPTDITGPILLALPSVKPTCVACDVNGKVFPSEIVNILEGDLATAEPHDVRQVWIASTIAGTDEVSFKGHHGRYVSARILRFPGLLADAFSYLSCDKAGLLSATREAISPEESFLCIPSSKTPGTFSVQTVRQKFLNIVAESKVLEIRGDAESICFNTNLRIRMQSRFKPRLMANKELKTREKVSKKELEEVVGRRLEECEVKRLKKARVQGDYHEAILDVRVKGKHDKYS